LGEGEKIERSDEKCKERATEHHETLPKAVESKRAGEQKCQKSKSRVREANARNENARWRTRTVEQDEHAGQEQTAEGEEAEVRRPARKQAGGDGES
jgi:hypothetical protein